VKLILQTLLSLFFLVGISGCDGKVYDFARRFLDFVTLNNQSNLTLVSNTTTQNQPICGIHNKIIIQKSFPSGHTLYCRDSSSLSSTVVPGPVCAGGVTIAPITSNGAITECAQDIKICGVSPSSVQTIGSRADGGTIDQLTYDNLPWGCEAKLEMSFDPSFAENATSRLSFYVQPPECQFCPRRNQSDCFYCEGIHNSETIISGQVILTNCGSSCAACPVLHDPGHTIPHGIGKVYYNTDQSACGAGKCSDRSLLRICNNGNWMGSPAYEFPQCIDAACGCTLPGSDITYTHNSSTTIYQTTSPACGVLCPAVAMTITCNDGKWQTGSPARFLTDADWAAYPARSCTRRICHCERPGRDPVADGQTKHSNTVNCSWVQYTNGSQSSYS
jgi:hypothetical protein